MIGRRVTIKKQHLTVQVMYIGAKPGVLKRVARDIVLAVEPVLDGIAGKHRLVRNSLVVMLYDSPHGYRTFGATEAPKNDTAIVYSDRISEEA